MVLTAESFPFPSVCFKVFDVDRDGVLSRTELKDMVVALLEVWKDNRTDKIPVSGVWGLISFCFLKPSFQRRNVHDVWVGVSEVQASLSPSAGNGDKGLSPALQSCDLPKAQGLIIVCVPDLPRAPGFVHNVCSFI